VTGGPPPLAVEGIRVSFGGNHVLEGVNLTVEHDFTGLIGPNGAGKTTLFNVISGYVKSSAGTIHIAGKDVTGASQTTVARRGVGRTFQTPKLIGDLTVLENVLLGIDGRASFFDQLRDGWLFAASARANRARAREVLEQFALGAVTDLEAGSLPLGSQKIVEVCRALVAGPSLLLLDEPAAGLGRDDVEQLVEPLRAWVAHHGTTVVIIEHDLELVTNLCDDVAVLHLGTIIARGTPAECMRHPDVIEAYLGAGVAASS
jgi:branched-chain amino acid transport system ATP-binding protein